jgi:PEP-CTERM motif
MRILCKATIAAAALAGLIFTGGVAQAGTVTFDDSVANSLLLQQFVNGQSFSDQGLTFTDNGAYYMYVWDGSSPNSNGTNNNIFGFGSSDYETIKKTDGGTFDLFSIDLAISWYDPNSTETITVNGSPLTITQMLTNYDLNMMNVMSVNISGVPSDSGYWVADNIVTNVGGVPEPSTWAMMLLGFAGLGFTGFRRGKKSRLEAATL